MRSLWGSMRSSSAKTSGTSRWSDCPTKFQRTKSSRSWLNPSDSISNLTDWVWSFKMGSFRGRQLLKFQPSLPKWSSPKTACSSANATSKSSSSTSRNTPATNSGRKGREKRPGTSGNPSPGRGRKTHPVSNPGPEAGTNSKSTVCWKKQPSK